MSLQQQLNDHIKQAMLGKETDRLNTLRLVKSSIGYAQIEAKVDALSDAEVQGVLQREAKKRKDAIAGYEAGGRPESAAQELIELRIIEDFLPKKLTTEEVEKLVREAIAEVGAKTKKDMGLVMKAATTKAAGRADGKQLSVLVGKLLP